MTGRVRLVVDDAGDGAGRLVVPAAHATAAEIAVLVRHGSGFLSVTLTAAAAVRLDLPPMQGADDHADVRQRVSVDAASGVRTGISALDRARTAALLAEPTTTAADLTRPGHVVPVVVETDRPSLPVDRLHLAVGESVVLADVPGGPGGTGLADTGELVALAAALGVPVLTTRPRVEEPDEFLEQLRVSLLVVR